MSLPSGNFIRSSAIKDEMRLAGQHPAMDISAKKEPPVNGWGFTDYCDKRQSMYAFLALIIVKPEGLQMMELVHRAALPNALCSVVQD